DVSLYFNWSCDFQRFTKSKKLSKFQVRTTTLFISNKGLSTSLFNLQGAIFLCLQQKIAPRVKIFMIFDQGTQMRQHLTTKGFGFC
ncbi:hypothetical protein DWV55_09220, partial [Butyricicoccus sp. AF10-3]